MKKPIRVLQIGDWDFGKNGIAEIVYNLSQNIDNSIYIYDFLVMGCLKENNYRKNIIKKGGNIYELKLKNSKLKKIYEVVNILKFLKSKEYRIVHIHESTAHSMFFYGILFKISGIETIIFHSHNSNLPSKNKIKLFLHFISKQFLKFISENNLACSEEAAVWMYSKFVSKNVTIIENTIDLKNFSYNLSKRNKLRKKLKIENNIILGNIGRLSEQKNQIFLLELLKEIKKELKEVKLILIGSGTLKDKIINKIEKLKIENEIILIENTQNIEDYYQIMDFFLLPSLYEGLPVVGIEAQAMGLPCYFSNKITSKIKINDNVKFMELNIEYWKNSLIYDLKNLGPRVTNNKIMENFSIKKMSKRVEEYYSKLKI